MIKNLAKQREHLNIMKGIERKPTANIVPNSKGLMFSPYLNHGMVFVLSIVLVTLARVIAHEN